MSYWTVNILSPALGENDFIVDAPTKADVLGLLKRRFPRYDFVERDPDRKTTISEITVTEARRLTDPAEFRKLNRSKIVELGS